MRVCITVIPSPQPRPSPTEIQPSPSRPSRGISASSTRSPLLPDEANDLDDTTGELHSMPSAFVPPQVVASRRISSRPITSPTHAPPASNPPKTQNQALKMQSPKALPPSQASPPICVKHPVCRPARVERRVWGITHGPKSGIHLSFVSSLRERVKEKREINTRNERRGKEERESSRGMPQHKQNRTKQHK